MSGAIPLINFAVEQAAHVDHATLYRWADAGVFLTTRPQRGPRMIPGHELPLARLAVRLHRIGIPRSTILHVLAALRETPPEERRARFAESVLLRVAPGEWIFLMGLDRLPQPGQTMVAHLLGEML